LRLRVFSHGDTEDTEKRREEKRREEKRREEKRREEKRREAGDDRARFGRHKDRASVSP